MQGIVTRINEDDIRQSASLFVPRGQDITVQNCGLEPVEAEAESAVEAEGDRKRREADPQLLVPGVLPYAAPVVPLLKHVCKEETQEYCYPETKVVEDTITTKSCKPVTENECEDVEIPGSKIEYVDNCRVSCVKYR